MQWYHNLENKKIKLKEGQPIPEGFIKGWGPRGTSWNKGLKADTDERVKLNTQKTHETRRKNNNYKAWNKGLTKETDPRIKGSPGELNGMFGKHHLAWNKGLTKETSSSLKKMSDSRKGQKSWNKGLTKETDERIMRTYQNSIKPEHQLKRYETMKRNKTLGIHQDTKCELDILEKLKQRYSKEDIFHPYFDDRYPFRCDFYIKSEDLFIEVHGNWTHNNHPFDPTNEDDIKQLNEWKEKAKKSKYYGNAIYTWTNLDVRKVQIAKQNNLNYIVIYYNKSKEL